MAPRRGSGPPSFIAESDAQAATGSTVTVAKPTGTVSGDLIIGWVISEDELVSGMLPSGFTKLFERGETSFLVAGFQVGYKFAGGSEPASYDFTVSNGGGAYMQTWRGAGTPQCIGINGGNILENLAQTFRAKAENGYGYCILSDGTTSKVPGSNSGWDGTTSFDDTEEHGGWAAHAVPGSDTDLVAGANATDDAYSALVTIPKTSGTPPHTISCVGEASDYDAAVTLPDNIVSGDLILIANLSLGSGSAPTNVVPTGFTQLNTSTGAESRATISYKIANGSESGGVITGMNGSSQDIIHALVLRKSGGFSSASLFDAAYEETDATPATQTVNASGGTAPLIVLAIADVFFFVPVISSFSGDLNIGNHSFIAALYEDSLEDVTLNINDGGGPNMLFSAYVELS